MNNLDWIIQYNIENNNEYGNYVKTGKYLAILKPEHHLARIDGYVYIHQLQAEKMLGRLLNQGECVHHKDENKYNNSIDNLIVFHSVADHTAYHRGADIYEIDNVWYAKENEDLICPLCGQSKDRKANLCVECYKKLKSNDEVYKDRKIIKVNSNIPSKDELTSLLIELKNFVKIGKLFGVSDNAVRKWCKKYNLPFRTSELYTLI